MTAHPGAVARSFLGVCLAALTVWLYWSMQFRV